MKILLIVLLFLMATTLVAQTTWRRIGNTTYGDNAQTGESYTARQIGNTTYIDTMGRYGTKTTSCRAIGNNVYCD